MSEDERAQVASDYEKNVPGDQDPPEGTDTFGRKTESCDMHAYRYVGREGDCEGIELFEIPSETRKKTREK